MTESASGEVRYLLSDGLSGVRHVTDEAGQLVSTHEFDPYGVPLTEPASDPYGYTGEWWQADIGLLHLQARWYEPHSGTFLSKDPFEGHLMRPQSMNGWNYAEGNPINLTDPSGLYVWFNRGGRNFSWQHRVIENWFERRYGSFWKTHHEFNKLPSLLYPNSPGKPRPDIIHFPRILNPQNCGAESPIDFRNTSGYLGEIYEIEPIRLVPWGGGTPFTTIINGEKQLLQYYSLALGTSWSGLLHDTFGSNHDREGRLHAYKGKRWDLNSIYWRMGGTMPLYQPLSVPANGQFLSVVSPAPGLILYADQVTKNQFNAVGKIVSAATLVEIGRRLLDGTFKFGSKLKPAFAGAASGLPILPEILINPTHPYNPANPQNCWDHPEFCGESTEL